MPLVKHPQHGNKHVAESEVAALVKDGWVKWPRSVEQKGPRTGNKFPPSTFKAQAKK